MKLIDDHSIKHLKSQNNITYIEIVLKIDIYHWGGKRGGKNWRLKIYPPNVAIFGKNLADILVYRSGHTQKIVTMLERLEKENESKEN